MLNTRDIIVSLKEVKEERHLSINDIVSLIEENGDYVSRSSVQRVFAEGSEDVSFKYEETIRPIAKVLLDIENIKEDDSPELQGIKEIVQYKLKYIEELERQIAELKTSLDTEKIKYHEKLDKEREQYQRSIDFLKEQISLKDKRMDQLLEAVFIKDSQHKELLEVILSCPARKDGIKCVE